MSDPKPEPPPLVELRGGRIPMSRHDRLKVFEYWLAIAGFVLLADAGGWRLAAAFALITWSANLRAKRFRT